MTRVVLLYTLATIPRCMHSGIATDPEICLWIFITMQPIFYDIGQHRTIADIPQADYITDALPFTYQLGKAVQAV